MEPQELVEFLNASFEARYQPEVVAPIVQQIQVPVPAVVAVPVVAPPELAPQAQQLAEQHNVLQNLVDNVKHMLDQMPAPQGQTTSLPVDPFDGVSAPAAASTSWFDLSHITSSQLISIAFIVGLVVYVLMPVARAAYAKRKARLAALPPRTKFDKIDSLFVRTAARVIDGALQQPWIWTASRNSAGVFGATLTSDDGTQINLTLLGSGGNVEQSADGVSYMMELNKGATYSLTNQLPSSLKREWLPKVNYIFETHQRDLERGAVKQLSQVADALQEANDDPSF